MKSLGVYYWYVKMLRCGCVDHGLQYLRFMFENIYPIWMPVLDPPLVRDGPLGARICETRLLYIQFSSVQVDTGRRLC